jgi:hypothetical protein
LEHSIKFEVRFGMHGIRPLTLWPAFVEPSFPSALAPIASAVAAVAAVASAVASAYGAPAVGAPAVASAVASAAAPAVAPAAAPAVAPAVGLSLFVLTGGLFLLLKLCSRPLQQLLCELVFFFLDCPFLCFVSFDLSI